MIINLLNEPVTENSEKIEEQIFMDKRTVNL